MIDVEIEDDAWTTALPDAEAVVRRAAAAALADMNSAHPGESRPPALSGPQGAEELGVTILLTDDEAVRVLNARFRAKDAPTNVLSFPAPEAFRPHLGDIALAYGVCAREADEQGKPLAHHLMHLASHGVLHLLGYDHQDDAQAEAMEAHERAILSGLGVPDPYAAESRTQADAR